MKLVASPLSLRSAWILCPQPVPLFPVPLDDLVFHLHDTSGSALSCCLRAMELGIRRFDSSCGGLGGCPYAPGASGNLSTGELLKLCEERGVETGVDPQVLRAAAIEIWKVLGRPENG